MRKRRKDFIDLTGRRFGKLVVVRQETSDDGVVTYPPRWICKCDCGRIKSVFGANLKNGTTSSCRCNQRAMVAARMTELGNRTPTEERAARKVLSVYVCRARSLKREFSLGFKEFFDLILSDCHYCGSAPNNTVSFDGSGKTPKGYKMQYNGLDRVDSSLGYVSGNVVPCCPRCNIAKRDMTETEFYNWLCDAYETFVVKRAKKPAA